MRKLLPTVLTCVALLGCSTGQESPDANPGVDGGKTPDTPNAVMATLYQPILEPFTATFTYTHTTYDQQTSSEETYAAIKTTIVQDADLDISVVESGRWWNSTADHLLVDGELYVRNREIWDDVKTDLAGVDKNHWVPYHDWVPLALEATESYVLSDEEFSPGVKPERTYRARAPLTVFDGEQMAWAPPEACVTFTEGRPDQHIVRLDDTRWQLKCATGLGGLHTFIAEFDPSGRLVRLHDGQGTDAPMYELTITYGTGGDIEKPDTSWWDANQELVRERLERLAETVFSDETAP